MFKAEKNRKIREWFVSNHNREQKDFLHNKCTEFIEWCQLEFDFFEFLRRYYRLKGIPLPNFEKKPQNAEELPKEEEMTQELPQLEVEKLPQ